MQIYKIISPEYSVALQNNVFIIGYYEEKV